MPLRMERKQGGEYTVGHTKKYTMRTSLIEGWFNCVLFLQPLKQTLWRAHCVFCLYYTSLQIYVRLNVTKLSKCFCSVLKFVLISGKMAAATSEGNGKLEHV